MSLHPAIPALLIWLEQNTHYVQFLLKHHKTVVKFSLLGFVLGITCCSGNAKLSQAFSDLRLDELTRLSATFCHQQPSPTGDRRFCFSVRPQLQPNAKLRTVIRKNVAKRRFWQENVERSMVNFCKISSDRKINILHGILICHFESRKTNTTKYYQTQSFKLIHRIVQNFQHKNPPFLYDYLIT